MLIYYLIVINIGYSFPKSSLVMGIGVMGQKITYPLRREGMQFEEHIYLV